MLRKILESKLGPLTNAQFAEIMDLATTDIRVNRVAFKRRANLHDVIEIAVSCHVALSRGKVA